MAGFRNVIVHGYIEADLDIVHRLLNERLDDLGEFARRVSRYLGDDDSSTGEPRRGASFP